MEKNTQFPTIPSNYVTLSQLQERWLKDQQQRNLKEKELQETENQQTRQQNLENVVSHPNIDAPNPKEESENRRSGNRKYRGRNQKLKGRFPSASSEEALVGVVAVVEGNESESSGIEKASEALGDNPMEQKRKGTGKKTKKKNKMKKQKQKDQMVNDGETESQREKEVIVLEEPALPAKSEKKSIPVSEYAIKRDFRPKNADLVEKSDFAAKSEGEAKDVKEKSENTVQIEKNIEDLCIDEGSDRSEVQNNTFNRRNGEYRSRGRIVNNSYSRYRGDIRTVNHGDSQYRGYNGGFNRRSGEYRGSNGGGYGGSGHYRGSYERLKEKDSGSTMVWVKKEVAVGTDDA